MQPYRLFFPLGIFYGLLGGGVWIAAYFKLISYPGIAHAYLMVGGFLSAFFSGFLMTAVPRFLGSFAASDLEKRILLFLSLLPLIIFFSDHFLIASFANFLSAITLLFLLVFYYRRYFKRDFDPSPGFYLIPAGLAIGIVGFIFIGLYYSHRFDFLWGNNFIGASKAMAYQGLAASLIGGVGGKLIPVLLGLDFPQAVEQFPSLVSQGTKNHGFAKKIFSKCLVYTERILFFGSFVLEFFEGYENIARFMRASALTIVIFGGYQVYRWPKNKKVLSWGLWCALLFFCGGFWGVCIKPEFSVHMLHLSFVGGFSLITFMVATRVTLAHGGHGLLKETNSRILGVAIFLILLAALTRATAILLPASYTNHLVYASATWIFGVAFWTYRFLPKIIILKKA